MVEQALEGIMGFLCGSVAKNPPAMQEMQVRSLGQQNHLEEGIATHSSSLAWRIPWTEEPDRLHSLCSRKELDTTWRKSMHKWGWRVR